MIPFIKNSRKCKLYSDRKQISGCLETVVERRTVTTGHEEIFKGDENALD